MSIEQPPICDYEDSDYQTSFWDKGERVYEDRVESIALRRLLPDSGRMMLEIGAGAGRNTPRYHAYQRVVLLDYSRTQLLQARERLGGSERYIFVAADVYQLPFVPGSFDGGTMIRTLHHMAAPKLALEQIRMALQPGGIFILEYANKHNLKAIIRYMLGQQSWSPFSRDPIEFAKLNFDFHPESIRTWLADCGFQVKRQLTVSHFRVNTLKRIIPLDILVQLDSVAQLTGNWWQLSPSVFVMSHVEGDSPIAPTEAIFRCLSCGFFPLENLSAPFTCPSCGQEWPYQDGIYDFRLRTIE